MHKTKCVLTVFLLTLLFKCDKINFMKYNLIFNQFLGEEMNKNIFTELKSNYEFLTKSEKKITDFLLEKPQQFITLSTAKLSEIARGFTRFLQSVGTV